MNLANSSNMLHKHAYKDSLFPLTAQILIPTASITTADCLLLYSFVCLSKSLFLNVFVAKVKASVAQHEFWPSFGLVMSGGQMPGIS